MPNKKDETRNIGLNVQAPTKSCDDKLCPFHGTLPVRGQIITGVVSSVKMKNSILVKKEYMNYIPKYERYEKRTSKFAAHCPPCIDVQLGDRVRIAECRPLSKTISFVTIEKM
ncbi:MAG: 30S ribosomal protein S17 [Thermoplasmatales archaeon]|nr:MAG: 30S ribosomal protein S17 [Thermoplasmatales archaeon]